MQDIKPLAHIEMLKFKTAEYKQLEEDYAKLVRNSNQLVSKLERAEANGKLLEDENAELKAKLLNTTIEMQKLRKICDNHPQMAVLE